jgi:hypothetical protein
VRTAGRIRGKFALDRRQTGCDRVTNSYLTGLGEIQVSRCFVPERGSLPRGMTYANFKMPAECLFGPVKTPVLPNCPLGMPVPGSL